MKNWIKRKLINPLRSLMTRGVSPAQLALAITFGVLIAVVPVFGAATAICLAVIGLFRVNPVATLLINQFAYPLQFVLYIPFIRTGEWIFDAEPLTLSASEVFDLFTQDLLVALNILWWSTLYALVAWLLICIPLGYLLYFVLKKVLERSMRRRSEV